MFTGIIVLYDKIFYIKSQFFKNWGTKKFSVYVVVQSPSRVQVFVTPWSAAPRPPVPQHLPVVSKSLWPHGLQHPGPLSLTISQSYPSLCHPMACSTQAPCLSPSPSCVQVSVTPWTAAPRPPVPHYLPEFAPVHVHCISDAIQPSHPLMPASPSTLNLFQQQGLFQWVSCLHPMSRLFTRKYWSFSFSMSPFKECSGLISLKIDWFDLFEVQGTFRSLFPHHSSKASILWLFAFFLYY